MDTGQARNKLSKTIAVPQHRHSEGGFTFLEVIVALALLAVSASMLIGMEGSAIRRTIRDTNAQQAMLAARRVMSVIEAMSDKDFNLSSQDNRSVPELLDALGVPPNPEEGNQSQMSALIASILVEDLQIPIPNMVVDPMKKIVLTIRWSQSRDDWIRIYYARNAAS
jgi:prepilin-type N-terminal cleavage/methylation domain-containing protein